jgi:ankyrin repeat protein
MTGLSFCGLGRHGEGATPSGATDVRSETAPRRVSARQTRVSAPRRRGKWVLLLVTVALAQGAGSDSEKLYDAIRAGDLSGLGALLDGGISPDVRDSREITPLMYAAETGSVAEMRMLIDHHAAVNAQNAFGATALMWSVSDIQKVRLLLEHGADVNIAAKSGTTALLIALGQHSPEVARLLIEKGADQAAVDKNGFTALLAAVRGNDMATIRLLVEAGADVNQMDRQPFLSYTPLMGAAASGNLAAVKLLLAKGAKVNTVSPQHTQKINNRSVVTGEMTALLLAATYGPPEIVKALLDAGAEVNVAEARGMTPLMLALTTDRLHPETVTMLLEQGADPRTKSMAGETALDWARKYGVVSVIESLGGKPAGRMAAVPAPSTLPDPRVAVERSVGLLEKTSAEFFVEGACYACHAQSAASIAAGAARTKGIPIDEHAASERLKQTTFTLASAGPSLMEGRGAGDTGRYIVEALARTGYAPDRVTDYVAAAIAAEQGSDGGWHGAGGLARTPLEDGDFSRTAMAIRVLKGYGTPARAAETKERIARGRQWLIHAEPLITEDWDMRLTGVAVAGGNEAELRKLAAPILALQRPDGGWGQRTELPSDAYATGMTLSALAETGIVQTESEVYRRGVKFLLASQADDGSWHVASRAAKLQPYFESGFPYGHDQWISSMGTGWAANALALGLKGK